MWRLMGKRVPDILVEVSAGSSGDLSAHPSSPELFAGRADELAASIAEIATMLRPRLEAGQLDERDGWELDQVEFRFDVSLAVGTGVLVAKSNGTGTFTVRLTWKSPDGGKA
jgi:hypothetical protein